MKKLGIELLRVIGVALVLYAGYNIVERARAGVSCSMPFTFVNGTVADATQVNSNFNAVVTCLGNAAAAGVNADITQLAALTTPLTPASGGTPLFAGTGPTTGSVNAQIVATTLPNNFALNTGYKVSFVAGFSNNAAMTLTVGSAGAVTVLRKTQTGPQVLVGGEIIAGNAYNVTVASGSFVLDSDTQLVGQIAEWHSSTVPAGWTMADGTCQTAASQPFVTLFAVIGTSYGNCGAGTFNMPDLRGRAIAGLDNMGTAIGAANRLTNVATGCGTAFTVVGVSCANGAQNQTLAQNQLPNIVPTFTGNSPGQTVVGSLNTNDFVDTSPAAAAVTSGNNVSIATPTGTISSINGNVTEQAHPIVNPNIGFYKMIKL